MLEREIEFTKQRSGRFGMGYSVKICYKCRKTGHQRFCRELEIEADQTYFNHKKEIKRRKNFRTKTSPDLNELIEKYPKIFKVNEKEIIFSPVEKCQIETEKGKIVVKTGTCIPQSKEAEEGEYIKDSLERIVMRYSVSQWRTPLRFMETR